MIKHKSGFVNIIGNSNVGKSTLINTLVNKEISIVTNKLQTTRHKILGILNNDKFQIIFSDTPGLIKKTSYLLQKKMMNIVYRSLYDSDIIIYVTDIYQDNLNNKNFLDILKNINLPIIIVINKIDKYHEDKLIDNNIKYLNINLPKSMILLISALKKININILLKKVIELLPNHPPFYPKNLTTNKSLYFFISETIRKYIIILYRDEIPYSVEVIVEELIKKIEITYISCKIITNNNNQKGILIGHKGKMLKILGIKSRRYLEIFFVQKIFLDIRVKTIKKWRSDPIKLKKFGYY